MKKRFLLIIAIIFIIILMVLGTIFISLKTNKENTDDKIILKINEAIIDNNINKVKTLIKGVDLNTIYDVGNNKGYCNAEESTYSYCLAPIQVAYLTNNYNIVKLLIENGADVNFDKDLYFSPSTPLGNIIEEYWGEDNLFNEETYQIVELLIENGVSVTTDDGTFDGTPIEKLVFRRYKNDDEKRLSLKMFKLFEKNGAKLTSEEYITPLIDLAKQSKNQYIVEYLQKEKGM